MKQVSLLSDLLATVVSEGKSFGGKNSLPGAGPNQGEEIAGGEFSFSGLLAASLPPEAMLLASRVAEHTAHDENGNLPVLQSAPLVALAMEISDDDADRPPLTGMWPHGSNLLSGEKHGVTLAVTTPGMPTSELENSLAREAGSVPVTSKDDSAPGVTETGNQTRAVLNQLAHQLRQPGVPGTRSQDSGEDIEAPTSGVESRRSLAQVLATMAESTDSEDGGEEQLDNAARSMNSPSATYTMPAARPTLQQVVTQGTVDVMTTSTVELAPSANGPVLNPTGSPTGQQIANPTSTAVSPADSGAGTSQAIRGQVLTQLLQIGTKLESGNVQREIILQLDPPELGRVSVLIQQTGNSLTVTFSGMSPEALAAMREGVDELVESLLSRGGTWEDVQVRFSKHQMENQERESPDRRGQHEDKRKNSRHPFDDTENQENRQKR